jgi:glycolate oxidase FAD binding subunit
MDRLLRPGADWELAGILADLDRRGARAEIVGGGTKRTVGRPGDGLTPVLTTGFRGIPLYEPSELVMSALAGTPLAEVEAELAKRGQVLPFEPIDVGPALGGKPAGGTIGAVFMTNLSGSRRIAAGSARDHLIGLKGVNGRGEIFKSGGRVVKNVTGYDLARAVTGSWGTLAVATEVTFKVVPKPEQAQTLILFGLPDEIAIEALCLAHGTPIDVTGTIHVHSSLAPRFEAANLSAIGKSVTAVRIEGFERFLPARVAQLRQLLAPYGDVHVVGDEATAALWGELRRLSVLCGSDAPLWRISVPPRSGPEVVDVLLRHMEVSAYYDWSGGLIWLEVPGIADAGATDIRRIVARVSGHATLIRASEAVRRSVDVFHPLEPAIERITRGLKAAFDPTRLLNPDRMYAGL